MSKSEQEMNKPKREYLTKLLLIISIYIFYLGAGLFEEKLTKTKYLIKENETTKYIEFKFPSIIIVFSSIISVVVALFMKRRGLKKIKNHSLNPLTNKDKVIIGIIHIISRYAGSASIIFLDYIVKTIGKSCKSASLIFINFLFNFDFVSSKMNKLLNIPHKLAKERINSKDIYKVILIFISVCLFTFGSNKKANNEQSNSLLGFILLGISLLFDGIKGVKEKNIIEYIHKNEESKQFEDMISWEYMFTFGLFSIFFCGCEIIYQCIFGNYLQIMPILFRNKTIWKNLIFYSIFDCFGQVVIFSFLGKYGPLSLSMTTAVRKILTIALSILYFGKSISFPQSISLIISVGIILLEVFDKKKVIKKE